MKEEIEIFELSQKMHLGYATMIALIDELQLELKGIAQIIYKDSNCTLELCQNIQFQELCYRIYENSKVLKCLEFMMKNNKQEAILKFAEKSFISLPTAYRIRKTCINYLQDIGFEVKKIK